MSDIDPVRLDVLAKPRRRRRANVPANMRPALAEAEKRARARPAVPGLMIEPTEGDFDHPTYRSPWVDREACKLMLADCFATRSVATFQTFVDQIIELCRKRWDYERNLWARDEGELNQALNFVSGLRPQNEGEAALCVKLCANYLMGVRIAGRALSGGWVDPKDSYATAALDRAYASLWDALNRGRGKGKTTKQKIEVHHERHIHTHRHVHIDRGGAENPAINPMEARDAVSSSKMPAQLANAPRCHARNRSGNPCKRAAAKGKRVCANHGARAGAPKGQRNGNYRHGAMTTEAIAERREARALVRSVRAMIDA